MKYKGTTSIFGDFFEKHNCTQKVYTLLPKFIKEGQEVLCMLGSRKPNADFRRSLEGISNRRMQSLKKMIVNPASPVNQHG